MDQFLAMGGYATFVWPSYALSVFVLVGLAAWSWKANRRTRDMLRRMETQGKDS
jgi:heme exporter protein D